MRKQWYHIFFVTPESGKPDGKLRLRVRWSGNTLDFSLGYRVDVEKWSGEAQRCKSNTTHGKKRVPASEINREISRYEEEAESLMAEYERAGVDPTKEQFRADFVRRCRGEQGRGSGELSFFEVFDAFTREMGQRNNWTTATYQKFRALRNHIYNYNPGIKFSDLDDDGLSKFVYYLRTDGKLINSTISNRLGFVKWFLRWAAHKGYHSTMDFQEFSPRLKKAEHQVVFLDWDELMRVYHWEFPKSKEHLGRVRDVFCFCCFTGLRYSDVANLRKSAVADDCIHVTTIKTHDTITVELNDYARAILDKYAGRELPENRALPVISNQKTNQYLKELGKAVGIDEPITKTYYTGQQRIDETRPKYELIGTHTARRTFICNALMLGIPAEIVMKWTGHSDYKAMRPYIDIADKAKREAMKLFNKKG